MSFQVKYKKKHDPIQSDPNKEDSNKTNQDKDAGKKEIYLTNQNKDARKEELCLTNQDKDAGKEELCLTNQDKDAGKKEICLTNQKEGKPTNAEITNKREYRSECSEDAQISKDRFHSYPIGKMLIHPYFKIPQVFNIFSAI